MRGVAWENAHRERSGQEFKEQWEAQVSIEIELFFIDPLTDQRERLGTVDAHVVWTVVRLNQSRQLTQRSFAGDFIG